jgi:hypothetical protein
MDSLSTVMETVWHAEVADHEIKILKLLTVLMQSLVAARFDHFGSLRSVCRACRCDPSHISK